MDDSNYLIIVSINCGQNFALNESIFVGHEKVSACVLLETRLNQDVLTSDAIAVDNSDPVLATELCFQVDRKQLHLFRIERKPIKLKCFIEYSNLNERQFIGYTVIDLRNGQNFSDKPKYEWKTLLNPKYRGSSHKRPQVSIALIIHKLDENQDIDNAVENGNKDSIDRHSLLSDNRKDVLRKEGISQHNKGLLSLSEQYDNHFIHDNNIENDINVRLKNGFYHIWDATNSSENQCKHKYSVSITIAFAENIRQLFRSDQRIESTKPFHFRYTFLGTTVKTESFCDIDLCDFQIERTTFKMITTDENILCVYFELHSSLEIQFCDKFDSSYGFVVISLTDFSRQSVINYKTIEGSYMLHSDDESIEFSEPVPIIGISVELRNDIKQVLKTHVPNDFSTQTNEQIESPITSKHFPLNESTVTNLKHYCFAIDLRNIKVIDEELSQINSCYLQFSYAFFGFTDSIKTFPTIDLYQSNETIIPHGFCAFNFATSVEKLVKTFKEIPLMIEVIEVTKINTLIGTASIDLSKLLETDSSQTDDKHVVNLTVPVIDEQNKEWAIIQVIMFLQNNGDTQIPHITNSPQVSVLKGFVPKNDVSSESIKHLDDLIMETALEIEVWKEKQLNLFKEQLKQNEMQYFKQIEIKQNEREEEVKDKIKELTALENKLLTSLEDIRLRESQVQCKESEINSRYEKLNDEISEVINDIKQKFEQKIMSDRNKLKEVETEKAKYQERVYFLERKIKEKEFKIKELEEKVNEYEKKMNANNISKVSTKGQKPSLTKSTIRSMSSSPKKIIVTRDSDISPRSKMVGKNDSPIFSKTTITTPKPAASSTKTNSNNKINGNQSVNDEKKLLITKIKSERKVLIEKGIHVNDPIIKEIDRKLKECNSKLMTTNS